MNVVLNIVVADREWIFPFIDSDMKWYMKVDTRSSERQTLYGPGKTSLAGTES